MRSSKKNHYPTKYPLLNFHRNRHKDPALETEAKWRHTEYVSQLNAQSRQLPLGNVYLNSRLHDSRVTGIESDKHRFTIWLNDFHAHCFTSALCVHSGINIPKNMRSFRLGLRFNDVVHLSLSRIGANDRILPVSLTRYLPKLDELLYDEARHISKDRIEIGFLFLTCSPSYSNKYELLMEVSCKQMEIMEGQREDFEVLFSGRYLPLFDAFLKARQSGVNFDYSSSLAFIRQYESER